MPPTRSEDHTALRLAQKTIKKRFFSQFFLILVVSTLVAMELKSRLPIYHTAIIVSCALFYLVSFVYRHHQRRFSRAYKHQFVSAVIQGVFPGAVLTVDGCLSYGSLLNSGFFIENAYLQGEDLVCCQYNDTLVRFSDIHLQPFVSVNAKERASAQSGELFLGIVAELTFKTPFTGAPLMILHQKMQHLRLPKIYKQTPIETIKTLSPEFNRMFEARGIDQVTSRILLQPALIERITTLSSQQPLSISFIHNQVFLILPHVLLEFEAPTFLLALKRMPPQIAQIQSSAMLIKTMIDTLAL